VIELSKKVWLHGGIIIAAGVVGVVGAFNAPSREKPNKEPVSTEALKHQLDTINVDLKLRIAVGRITALELTKDGPKEIKEVNIPLVSEVVDEADELVSELLNQPPLRALSEKPAEVSFSNVRCEEDISNLGTVVTDLAYRTQKITVTDSSEIHLSWSKEHELEGIGLALPCDPETDTKALADLSSLNILGHEYPVTD
jgi:hypothetical protein